MAGEWTRHEVKDLIDAGKLVIGDGYRAKNSELTRTGLPFARAGNINDGFRFRDADYFPERDLARVGNKVSKPGDVVFTSKGTVGRFAFVRPTMPRFVYSPQLCFWRSLDPETIEPRFLFQWMFGREFFGQFKGVAGQTDMAEYVSLTDQRRMHITLPDSHEQRAIAHILGTLDDKIELNRRRNQTLEAMAHALFQDWFVDFGPVRAKMEGRDGQDGLVSGQRHGWRASGPTVPYLPTNLWQLFPDRLDAEGKPEGWDERPLDEIADFINGLALQKFPATDPDDSLPVIKIAELRNGISTKSDRASRDVPAKYIIKDGDFLFSWSGSLLAKFWTEGEGALNQHLFKVTSERYPMWFVSHWVHHHLEEFQAIAASKATTMGHIQRGHLKAAMTICPPDNVVERMGVVMAPLVEQAIQNELESRSLAQLRDTLLPKLISGELRVADAKRFVKDHLL